MMGWSWTKLLGGSGGGGDVVDAVAHMVVFIMAVVLSPARVDPVDVSFFQMNAVRTVEESEQRAPETTPRLFLVRLKYTEHLPPVIRVIVVQSSHHMHDTDLIESQQCELPVANFKLT